MITYKKKSGFQPKDFSLCEYFKMNDDSLHQSTLCCHLHNFFIYFLLDRRVSRRLKKIMKPKLASCETMTDVDYQGQ